MQHAAPQDNLEKGGRGVFDHDVLKIEYHAVLIARPAKN